MLGWHCPSQPSSTGDLNISQHKFMGCLPDVPSTAYLCLFCFWSSKSKLCWHVMYQNPKALLVNCPGPSWPLLIIIQSCPKVTHNLDSILGPLALALFHYFSVGPSWHISIDSLLILYSLGKNSVHNPLPSSQLYLFSLCRKDKKDPSFLNGGLAELLWKLRMMHVKYLPWCLAHCGPWNMLPIINHNTSCEISCFNKKQKMSGQYGSVVEW